jgi:very-short-patch-repair endonuclease
MKIVPPEPEVAVRPNRKVTGRRWDEVRVCWLNLAADEVQDGVTTPMRTVIDCARLLPFDEALAIADSALRSGTLPRHELEGVRVRGAGAESVRRVLRHADARAANPFESVLRALCIEAGLDVVPQHPIQHPEGVIHPDLVCPGHAMVFEVESWAFHATRRAFTRDCARYNLLVLQGWRVFRFSWEHVMLDQTYVRAVLAQCARHVERVEVDQRRRSPA